MVSLYPKAEAGNVMMVWVEKLLAAYSGSPTPKPEAKLNNLATSAVASTVPSLRLGGATCWQQICLKIRETQAEFMKIKTSLHQDHIPNNSWQSTFEG